jgi:signal transduction histidine kinase
LSKGILPAQEINVKHDDEIGEITRAIKELIDGLKRTQDFAQEIGVGNFKASFTPLSEKDTLGLSLIKMRDDLKKLNEYEIALIKEKSVALIEGQENERKRISRELHDGIGQLLTVMNLRLELIDDHKEIKSEIKSLINQTISEVRRISYNLMPGALMDFGLEAALRDFTENIKKYSGIPVHFTYEKRQTGLNISFDTAVAIFRIIQEGLNNIIKHAAATRIDLSVKETDSRIEILLTDNGKGFDPNTIKKGLGLKNMKERTEILNGKFIIESVKEKGTTLDIIIPVINKYNE